MCQPPGVSGNTGLDASPPQAKRFLFFLLGRIDGRQRQIVTRKNDKSNRFLSQGKRYYSK
jgi:hypothetical protein